MHGCVDADLECSAHALARAPYRFPANLSACTSILNAYGNKRTQALCFVPRR